MHFVTFKIMLPDGFLILYSRFPDKNITAKEEKKVNKWTSKVELLEKTY